MEHSKEFQEVFLDLVADIPCKHSKKPEILGIEYDAYTKIIEYGKLPAPKVLIRIADYFGVSLEYLLGRTSVENFEKAKTPTAFYERYETLKKEKGWTDYAITQKLHIKTSYTTAWKKKGYLPSLTNLILLSEEFEVSLDYLLGRTDYKD